MVEISGGTTVTADRSVNAVRMMAAAKSHAECRNFHAHEFTIAPTLPAACGP